MINYVFRFYATGCSFVYNDIKLSQFSIPHVIFSQIINPDHDEQIIVFHKDKN